MIDPFKSADEWILDKVQDAYLWLFDRTGIFVGMCMFVMMVTERALYIAIYGSNWYHLVLFAINGMCAWWITHKQTTLSITSYNHEAMAWQESTLRRLFVLYSFFSIIINLASLDFTPILAFVMICLYGAYLPAVMIRDREPPENRQLAPEGGAA